MHSRRFPEKNFSPFMEKNLISHAVIKLLEVPEIETIFISTDVVKKVELTLLEHIPKDDPGWKRICILGRPLYLTADEISTDAVVSHTLAITEHLQQEYPSGHGVEETNPFIVCTQVTTPNWTVPELKRALNLFINKYKWDGNPDGIGSLVTVGPGYWPNGAFYITTVNLFVEAMNKLYHPRTFLFTIPAAHGVDIDYEWGLRISEALARGDYT